MEAEQNDRSAFIGHPQLRLFCINDYETYPHLVHTYGCLYRRMKDNQLKEVIFLSDFLTSYFLLLSIIAIVLMCVDKHAAIHGKWRVRERTLILVACFGGALAMWMTMHAIRHKIRKSKFRYGVPAIFAGQIILLLHYF